MHRGLLFFFIYFLFEYFHMFHWFLWLIVLLDFPACAFFECTQFVGIVIMIAIDDEAKMKTESIKCGKEIQLDDNNVLFFIIYIIVFTN